MSTPDYFASVPYTFGTSLLERGELEEIAEQLRAAMAECWGSGPFEQSMSAYLVTCL